MSKRGIIGLLAVTFLAIACAGLFLFMRHRNSPATDHPQLQPSAASIRFPRNVEEFDRLFQEVSNWGRWGADDQKGAVNLITDEKRMEAIALARLGRTVSMSHALLTSRSPVAARGSFAGNGEPLEHTMDGDLTTDTLRISFHSFLHSHLDALCHFPYRGKDYNGYPAEQTNTRAGCTRLGVENLGAGIITRGILIDMPRLRGVEYLEPGTPVFSEDIEAWEKLAGVTIGPGDALFLRTGRWARWQSRGPWDLSQQEAGLHPSAARWLKQRGVSVIGSDAGLDVLPSPVQGIPDMPMHVMAINAIGMVVLDNHDLEEIARVSAELGRWEFLVTIAPLVIPGGTGSPVNTLAVF